MFQFLTARFLFFQLNPELALFFICQNPDRLVFVFQRTDIIRHVFLLITAKYRSTENVLIFHLSVPLLSMVKIWQQPKPV